MIEFGKTLREAREAKSYSISQLAEITHILPQIIENLEKEDFTRIVAPIYGRGFVKLYCETVGLDAQPLVAEFMEIYNGNRQPAIRLKEVEAEEPAPEPPAPEAPAASDDPTAREPESVPEPPPAEPPAFDFSIPPKRNNVFETPVRSLPDPPPLTPGPDDLPFRDETTDAPKRDYRMPGYSMPDVPRSFWRFGILLAAAAAIIALLVLGTRALYRATMRAPEPEAERAETASKAPSATQTRKQENKKQETRKKNTVAPRAPRKGVAVPPLYID